MESLSAGGPGWQVLRVSGRQESQYLVGNWLQLGVTFSQVVWLIGC